MNQADLAKHARQIFKKLAIVHADAHIELNFSNPFELLIATILSAQCTDVKVNQVTEKLFKQLRSPEDYLRISTLDLEELIRPTGFYRNKAKNIKGAAQSIIDNYGGKVPKIMEELVTIPGVGRKTANVVLGNAFNVPGLPVDTHVTRLCNRLGLTTSSDAVKIETVLCALLPKDIWTQFSHTLIFHGRRICKARGPKCQECPVTDLCQYFRSENQHGKRAANNRSPRSNKRRQPAVGN